MNVLDIGVLVLVGLSALAGYRRGLLRTVYGLVSFVLALALAGFLYQPVAAFLRGTPLFPALSRVVSSTLDLDSFSAYAEAAGYQLIDVLPLPSVLIDILHVNNNAVMYRMLNGNTLEEYISGFLANMAILAISILAVFILVLIILSIAGAALDVVGRLPIIRSFNDYGGLIVGTVFGIAIAGLTLFMMNLLFNTGANPGVSNLLQGSFIANWVLNLILPHLLGMVI